VGLHNFRIGEIPDDEPSVIPLHRGCLSARLGHFASYAALIWRQQHDLAKRDADRPLMRLVILKCCLQNRVPLPNIVAAQTICVNGGGRPKKKGKRTYCSSPA
jgi:hypothetical protein